MPHLVVLRQTWYVKGTVISPFGIGLLAGGLTAGSLELVEKQK